MAILYPALDEVIKNRKNYSNKEFALIFELFKLDDKYDVFINPYVNGDSIDIVILKKGCGAHIIQVYDYEDYKKLNIKPWNFLKVAEEQIANYKKNLYNLHIESLKIENLYNKNIYGCIKQSIFIYSDELYNLLKNNKTKNHINLLGKQDKIKEFIENSFNNRFIFNDNIYLEMKNLFEGKFKINNKIEKIEWTQKQKYLMKSENKSSKICGVAGSGKTLVLAKRAINAVIRTDSKVLILTYNITLRKYIEDKIGAFCGGLSKNKFKIIHFHEFIKQELNNNQIVDDSGKIYHTTIEELDGDLFNLKRALQNQEYKIKKYKVILIDEVQDFRYEWLDIIKTYFLDNSNGEYVLFGDEKQNVYNRSLDENRKSKTNIRGAWNRLSTSFRMDGGIQELCSIFQKKFFFYKYELDHISDKNITTKINQGKDNIRYLYRPNWGYDDIYYYLQSYVNNKMIPLSEICILSSNIVDLRELEFIMRKKYRMNCERVIETKEEYDEVCKNECNHKIIENKLRGIRRVRRFNFEIDSKKLKLCTVHSFKGWESKTLFVILDKEDKESKDEILYTALTRCKDNLIIINKASIEYDEFFKSVLKEEKLKFELNNSNYDVVF